MAKKKILLQLDGDPQASVFDAVVAVDSGIDHLFRHQAVAAPQVRDLVHGAMFTRGPGDLHNTAVFVGGSNVAAGESLLEEVRACFFGPMRVSVMMDASGANTTAAAAVLAAARHVDLRGATALVLAATGPVGSRSARLLARAGARVRVASRTLARAEATCASIAQYVGDAVLSPHQTATPKETEAALVGADVLIAAGAAGTELLSAASREACDSLRVAIDLNAVPPAGLAGIEVTDQAANRGAAVCYGAIGVGATKMKIHKTALARLFERNDLVLDCEEIFEIGRALERR